MSKQKNITEALSMIHDGDVVASSGFMFMGVPREFYVHIAKQFKETGHPKNLTILHSSGIGDNRSKGLIEMSEKGLITRYICSHFAQNQKIIDLVNANEIQAYNFPQGVIAHAYRAMAAGKPGEITKLGLGTSCDPRFGGGKMNEATTEDLVHLVHILDEEYLLYQLPKINVALLRGTYADEQGNITMEEEGSQLDVLDLAMATKTGRGKVIVQVKGIVPAGSLPRTEVIVPAPMVDAIVLTSDAEEYHRQTPTSFYNPIFSGRATTQDPPKNEQLDLNERKIISRRALLELKEKALVNLGIGIPEGVASVAAEEGLSDKLIFTLDSGLMGGVPAKGGDFGCGYNAWCCMPMISMLDFYNGQNLDFACLGFGEADVKGNVNVSKFGPKIAGIGGFMDIAYGAKTVLFCGTFTAGSLKIATENGQLCIEQEGSRPKFKRTLSHISFAPDAAKQRTLFITERCVLEATENGLTLTEIAPGMDLQTQILDLLPDGIRVSENLITMDERIFRPEPMNIE